MVALQEQGWRSLLAWNIQIFQSVFLGFSFFLNQFLLSSSGPKPQGRNNGDECVIISDSDEDEEKSQNLGQEDEDDDQVGGEVFLFTIMSCSLKSFKSTSKTVFFFFQNHHDWLFFS